MSSDPLDNDKSSLPRFARSAHASHCNRCLSGLPSTQVEADTSRLAVGFYCLGVMDMLGLLESKINETERERWRDWVWNQQSSGTYGTGFRPGPYMTGQDSLCWSDVTQPGDEYSEYDTPHLIMTYTALLSLAILRDDFKRLEKKGILKFLRSCQRSDGSFSSLPNGGDSDLRQVYCAFAISSILDDWSGIDVDSAVKYIQRCENYEGGYGQSPGGEALGGTTYCALASLHLAPVPSSSSSPSRTPLFSPHISTKHRSRTIRWLLQNQTPSGGFCGRTNKVADACYCFWSGASLHILGASGLVDNRALATFLSTCQFKFGGIAKAPEERPDPYHTYMAIAALAIYPPEDADESWTLPEMNALWNTTDETAQWIRDHIHNK
ncbi:terpenoid cyclases/Protein prenyltransferase [Cristinia sonorae]|uniref:Terpenoid cyclases/Protein prenyltransferase n=1 Tax=Cristinia sonorae TaxID=1940300 RepID=A0A8K0UI15_9AGAR|nr:terpenoid cyclases/Protein prenyltransferase [Cristinia sonorae]